VQLHAAEQGCDKADLGRLLEPAGSIQVNRPDTGNFLGQLLVTYAAGARDPEGCLVPAAYVTRPGWSRSVLALFTVYRLERR
jgi:hypothetical protein